MLSEIRTNGFFFALKAFVHTKGKTHMFFGQRLKFWTPGRSRYYHAPSRGVAHPLLHPLGFLTTNGVAVDLKGKSPSKNHMEQN